jgi:ABC-type molybdenum transport system ATPase subunit/photorepair protein PhrA
MNTHPLYAFLDESCQFIDPNEKEGLLHQLIAQIIYPQQTL